MKTYRVVLYSCLFAIAFAITIPLITLRSFPNYLDAWRSLLGILTPAFLLVVLLILFRRVSPTFLAAASIVFMAFLSLGSILHRIPFAFVLIFTIAAAILNWAIRNPIGSPRSTH